MNRVEIPPNRSNSQMSLLTVWRSSNLHGHTLAVGRQLKVNVLGWLANRFELPSPSIKPDEVAFQVARFVRKLIVVRRRKRPDRESPGHLFRNGKWVTHDFEPLVVEPLSQQRPFTHEEDIARRDIDRVRINAQNAFGLVGIK